MGVPHGHRDGGVPRQFLHRLDIDLYDFILRDKVADRYLSKGKRLAILRMSWLFEIKDRAADRMKNLTPSVRKSLEYGRRVAGAGWQMGATEAHQGLDLDASAIICESMSGMRL